MSAPRPHGAAPAARSSSGGRSDPSVVRQLGCALALVLVVAAVVPGVAAAQSELRATEPVDLAAVEPATTATPEPATTATPEPATTATPELAATATSEPADASSGDLVVAYDLERLPDRPGRVAVTAHVSPPASVTAVEVRPPDAFEVQSRAGFESADGELVWEREASDVRSPSMEYHAPANHSEDGTLETADVGAWSLFRWRDVDLAWEYSHTAEDAPTVVERPRAVGEGVVGASYAFLGAHRTAERTVRGERIRLVVPDAAEPAADPADVADALADASRDLRIGGRSDRVTAFVAPSPIEPRGRSSHAGSDAGRDLYVHERAPLDTPDSAWLHEYVHTRQDWETGEGVLWLDDASAEYYAALLTYRQGRIEPEAFYEYVRTDRAADAVLAHVEEPTARASYFKGMRVLAATDAEIRSASGGERRLEWVLRALNERDGQVTLGTLQDHVSAAATEPRGEWLAQYVETEAAPPVPPYLEPDQPADGWSPLDAVRGLVLAALLVALGAGAWRRYREEVRPALVEWLE